MHRHLVFFGSAEVDAAAVDDDLGRGLLESEELSPASVAGADLAVPPRFDDDLVSAEGTAVA